MTTPEPLSAATQMLRDAVADPGDVDALPPHRAAAVERIAEALRARGQARRRKRTMTTLALAAGVALVVSGGAFAVHRIHRDGRGESAANDARNPGNLGRLVDPTGGVTAVREGHTEPVGVGRRLAEGLELRTASAEAGLDFDTGSRHRSVDDGKSRCRVNHRNEDEANRAEKSETWQRPWRTHVACVDPAHVCHRHHLERVSPTTLAHKARFYRLEVRKPGKLLDGEHHRDDNVEHEIDLRFVVPAACAAKQRTRAIEREGTERGVLFHCVARGNPTKLRRQP